jgi:hypothetical protein
VPWSLNDIIGSSNRLKILSGQIGATHAFETAVLTLDRGPDCSLGALVAVLPEVGSALTLVVRQHPSASFGYAGYHVVVHRTGADTWTWEVARRDPQQDPVTLGALVTDGPALEAGCWVGAQAAGDEVGA